MTTPTPSRAGGLPDGIPLRLLTAWALLALAGAMVAFGFLGWIVPPSRTDFFGRFSVDTFTSVTVLVAPLLAVLVAVKVGPALAQAKLISLGALGVYAAAIVFGALAFLITLVSRFDTLENGIYIIGGIVQQLGSILITLLQLALLVLALLWTYQIFSGLGGRLPRLNVRAD